jgi:hypothetical protein
MLVYVMVFLSHFIPAKAEHDRYLRDDLADGGATW